jgi:hypothetical protein
MTPGLTTALWIIVAVAAVSIGCAVIGLLWWIGAIVGGVLAGTIGGTRL